MKRSEIDGIGFQILKTHSRNCAAFELAASGKWDHPWCAEPKTTWVSVGRGRRMCFVARCNNTDCDALIAIDQDDVLSNVNRG